MKRVADGETKGVGGRKGIIERKTEKCMGLGVEFSTIFSPFPQVLHQLFILPWSLIFFNQQHGQRDPRCKFFRCLFHSTRVLSHADR